jgi:hypothetical protein
MSDRTAVDTIKGYFYQFDHSIFQLLHATNNSDIIKIESIEDIDVKTATEETAIQCKYYAKTEYNHSVIGKPIRLMINHYKEVKEGTKPRLNYRLYGYFTSGQHKLTLPIDLVFLKDFLLTYTEKKIKYELHKNLALSDIDLNDFLSLLTIDISAMEYQAQISNITKLLMAEFKCTSFEAENFYYNNALKLLKYMATDNNVANRQINKSDFLSKINFKGILFNEWYIKFKGENKFFEDLRAEYFTALNISPYERFFLIEIPDSGLTRSELKELLLLISKKWSKLSKRENTPFCPYVYLHNFSEQKLIELKTSMQSEGFEFTDGYNFFGAIFEPLSIIKTASFHNGIKLKIINKINDLDSTLTSITKTKHIYQFYFQEPFYNNINEDIQDQKIQISELKNIAKII